MFEIYKTKEENNTLSINEKETKKEESLSNMDFNERSEEYKPEGIEVFNDALSRTEETEKRMEYFEKNEEERKLFSKKISQGISSFFENISNTEKRKELIKNNLGSVIFAFYLASEALHLADPMTLHLSFETAKDKIEIFEHELGSIIDEPGKILDYSKIFMINTKQRIQNFFSDKKNVVAYGDEINLNKAIGS